MAEPKIWSLSADAETEQIVARWQREFSPLVGSNRSRLVCMALKTLDRLGFTAERLMEALQAGQRINIRNAEEQAINLNKSQQLSSPAIEGRAKPLTRVVASRADARQRTINGVTRRVAVVHVADGAVGIGSYRSLSSPARIRFSYAQFNRRVA